MRAPCSPPPSTARTLTHLQRASSSRTTPNEPPSSTISGTRANRNASAEQREDDKRAKRGQRQRTRAVPTFWDPPRGPDNTCTNQENFKQKDPSSTQPAYPNEAWVKPTRVCTQSKPGSSPKHLWLLPSRACGSVDTSANWQRRSPGLPSQGFTLVRSHAKSTS